MWGPYAAAIARWETVTRPAPRPTDDAGRLSPLFVEWMQGLAPGWVTATPGLGRPAQLAALGNMLCRSRPPVPCRFFRRPGRSAPKPSIGASMLWLKLWLIGSVELREE